MCAPMYVVNVGNVGLAVGLSVGLFFLIAVITLLICVVVGIYMMRRPRRVRSHTATVLAYGQTSETSFNAAPPAHPTQHQQQADRDAQQLHRPSYDKATTRAPNAPIPQSDANPQQ